ncbi:H(+)/Cl(-) exchange transporter ClcA [bacterium MnTg02]|nr:H(+)/Cl(-) exchange transporter ClcA [bacterium MnTg02]
MPTDGPSTTKPTTKHVTMLHARSIVSLFRSGSFKDLIKRLTAQLILLAKERIVPNLRVFLGDRQPFVWLLAIGIGVGVAYFAILFRAIIGFVQLFWLGSHSERVASIAADLPSLVILITPAFGGLLIGLFLHFVMPNRRALGVADVIEARAIKDCNIPVKAGLGSAIVSAVSLGFGASAGREGPVVHLGAMLASAIEDLFKLPKSARRTILACGVAAAVSASFNAPIAGVLFAHEVILAHYALSAFVPIVISSVAATIIARIHLGDFPAFIIPDYQITSYWEFPAFALLGLTCAAVAILFQFSLIVSDRVASSVDIPLWSRPMIGGLMIGAIAVFFPQVLGVGYDSTDAALKQQFALEVLLALIVAKTAATAITLASRFGGGVFSPSLYLGAMTGGAFGLIAAMVFPEVASSHGLYAIVGMGAVAAAVLGAPISTTLIVFELTGGFEVSIALLLAVSISSGLSQAIHGRSFFHWQLATRGLFLQEGEHKRIIRSLRVRDFMTELEEDEDVPAFKPSSGAAWLILEDTLEAALRAFDRKGHHRIAVIDARNTSKIIGWADHWAALDALNTALIEVHVEEHR